jgi:hypothetical protein
MKTFFGMLCLSLAISGAAVGCGDDDDKMEEGVSVDTPGADVDVKALESAPAAAGAAGAAASAAEQR